MVLNINLYYNYHINLTCSKKMRSRSDKPNVKYMYTYNTPNIVDLMLIVSYNLES